MSYHYADWIGIQIVEMLHNIMKLLKYPWDYNEFNYSIFLIGWCEKMPLTIKNHKIDILMCITIITLELIYTI